jgi:hypothetical protein
VADALWIDPPRRLSFLWPRDDVVINEESGEGTSSPPADRLPARCSTCQTVTTRSAAAIRVACRPRKDQVSP